MTDNVQATSNISAIAKTSTADVEIETTETTYKTTHTAVRKARRFAVQGIYEWLMTDRRFEKNGQDDWKSNAPHDIVARTRATNAMHTVHLGYYHEMMRDIPQQIEEIDALISAQLDRDINRLDTIEHAILLIGTYELKHSLHIPYKVVLDESMKLNTHFGGMDGHKLINAVLDRLAKGLRTTEVNADGKTSKKTDKKSENSPKIVSETEVELTVEDTTNRISITGKK